MAYDIRFDVKQTGAETIDQISAKLVVMKTQVSAVGTEMTQAAKRVTDAEQQMAAAVASGHGQLAATLSGIVAKERAELETLVAKHRELKGSVDEVTSSFTRMTPAVTAANAEFAVMEGRLPTRALGRFASDVLGLGPLMQKAFPLFGLFAMGEMIVDVGSKLLKFIDKFDPLVQAEKRAEETTKSLTGEFKKLNDEIARMANASFEDRYGKTAGLAHEAAGLSVGNIGNKVMAAGLAADIARLQALKKTEISDYTTRPAGPAQGPADAMGLHLIRTDPKTGEKFYSDAPIDIDIATLKHQQAAFQEQIQVTDLTSGHLSHDSLKAQDSATATEDSKEAAAARPGIEAANRRRELNARYAARADEAEGKENNDPYAAIQSNIQGRINEDSKPGAPLSSAAMSSAQRQAVAENTKASLKLMAENAKRLGELTTKAVAAVETDQREQGRVSGDEFRKGLAKDISEGTKGVAADRASEIDQASSDASGVRRQLQASIRANSARGGGPGGAQGAASDFSAQLSAAQQIFDIEDKRVKLYDNEDEKIRDNAANKKQLAESVYQAQAQYEESLDDLREKNLEKYHKDAVSIFDALTNRQLGAGHALTLLLRKEALGQGAKLFANATAPILKTAGETLAGAVPASFRPFTKDTIFDPANRAVPGASDATQAATAANTGKTADWLAQIFRAMTGGSAPVASPAAATAPAKLPGILAYARGGGPPVGVPSLVGEEGPELFVPTTPGTILTAADTKRLLASGILAFAEGGGPPVSVLPAGANAPSPAALAIAQALDDNTQATGVLTKSIGQLYSGITGNSPDSSVGSAPAPNSLAGSLAQPVAALPALSPYTASGAGYGMPPGIIDQISGAAPLGTGILATLSTLRAQALSPSGGGGGAVVETGTALASIAKLISGAGGGVSSVVRGDALSNILGGGSGTPGVTVDLLGGEGTGGGGFVSAPTSTAPTPGLVAPLPVSYGGLANPLDGMSVSLPGYTPTTGQQIASGVGLAATIGAGTMGIISGLSQGGPRGDLTAAGSAAGIAGAVVGNVAKLLGAATPLLSAIPIIGSIAAVALPLIGSLFGNGPTQRANQINQELSANQYIAPQALNVTQSSNGNFTDFDARGNIRTSDFSAVPTVRQGFVWEQTHGLFGPPPTYYNVPGGQTSQFNPTTAAPAATIVNHNYAAGAIQAIDTQTFAEAIDKAHVAVGNAAAKNLQNMHGALATEVQRAANG